MDNNIISKTIKIIIKCCLNKKILNNEIIKIENGKR